MTYDFKPHIKGDYWKETVFQGTKNSVVIDFTGVIIAMKIRDCKNVELLSLSSAASGITITDAINGIFRIDGQILDIAAGSYNYDIQFTFISGEVYTWIRGKIQVIQDITY